MGTTTEPVADDTGMPTTPPGGATARTLQTMPPEVVKFLRERYQTGSADGDGVQGVREFSFATSWRADIPASIVVFLVALPLCLGIALASGAPLFSGLIAGIVGGLVVGAVSQSQLMVSGPAAGLTAIVVSAITTLGSFRAFLVAVVLAGVIQIVLGVLGAGIVGYVFPLAVIKGMLAAIGLILILKQIPHAVGYDANFQGDESFRQANQETTFSSIATAFERIEPGALVISLISLGILILWDNSRLKKIRMLPGPLAVVVVGTLLNLVLVASAPQWGLGGDHLVTLPVADSLSTFASFFMTPDWSAIGDSRIWRIAVTIGIVASLESLLSLSATNRIDPYRREPSTNRELVAQGVGNSLSGLIGGLPITGVIVRSAANVDAGAQTKASAIIHGALLLLAVALIPMILNVIPIAPLAAILLYTGFKLAHPKLIRHAWSQGWYQFIPFVATVIAILLTDLLVGIFLGLAIGFLFVLLDHLRTPCFTVVSPPGSVLMRLRLNENVTFLNKASLATMLENLPPSSRVEIDGRFCKRIDHDVLELIHEFGETARLRNIEIRLIGIPTQSIMPSH